MQKTRFLHFFRHTEKYFYLKGVFLKFLLIFAWLVVTFFLSAKIKLFFFVIFRVSHNFVKHLTYFICMNGRKLFLEKNEIFKKQKKTHFLGFFTQNVHFWVQVVRFFGFFQKNTKKVIFLENALIFEKKFFDLLR